MTLPKMTSSRRDKEEHPLLDQWEEHSKIETDASLSEAHENTQKNRCIYVYMCFWNVKL